MRWDEFLDKENGTRDALRVAPLTDDQRNQLRELAHEACADHCSECGACMTTSTCDNCGAEPKE